MQKILVPRVIALTGYAGVGKDTVADWLCNKYGYTKIAFADPLKDFVAELIIGEREIPPEFGAEQLNWLEACYNQFLASSIDSAYEFVRAKPYSAELRQLLQYTGTEYMRRKDSKYWIRSMHLDPQNFYIITDLRFPDELDFAKAIGALTIGLFRYNHGAVNDHVSETNINNLRVDHWIENPLGELDRTLERLDSFILDFDDERVPNGNPSELI